MFLIVPIRIPILIVLIVLNVYTALYKFCVQGYLLVPLSQVFYQISAFCTSID